MDTKTMIREVKNVAEKHKNDRKFTGQTVITDMCNDIIPKLEKLSEYETAEDEQRLLVLPCKIGDVVYVIDEAECLSIRKTTIEGITINERGICFMIPTKKANMSFGYYNSDFDKAVFFSIEEAEKALKETENKI